MATTPSPLLIAKGKGDIFLLPKMANRHHLVAGTTGTGKTVTLRVLAEQLSKIGVLIFIADVKRDLSGLPFPGGENLKAKAEQMKTDSREEAVQKRRTVEPNSDRPTAGGSREERPPCHWQPTRTPDHSRSAQFNIWRGREAIDRPDVVSRKMFE
jgi:type IV secretory pathway VirB4 component